MSTNEIWKPISGYENNYEISSIGKVRNIKSKRILKNGLAKGYRLAQLSKNGQRKFITIHRLVACTFLGYQEGVLRHLDGNKLNNAVENLRFGTAKENAEDRDRHGTTRRGENHSRAVLSNEIVLRIREMASDGLGPTKIGSILNMNKARVCEVVSRRTWKHI